jgi:hypothetical protein
MAEAISTTIAGAASKNERESHMRLTESTGHRYALRHTVASHGCRERGNPGGR